jgi:uncharacterized DUF497 family protein
MYYNMHIRIAANTDTKMHQFEWDNEKNKRNIRDHRISFKLAQTIWDRPVLEELDDDHSDNETRYKAIGLLANFLCITVIYTMRGNKIRIISAWIATPQERKRYYEQS